MKKHHKAPPKSARTPQKMPPNRAMQAKAPPMGAIPAMPLAPTAKLGGGVASPAPAKPLPKNSRSAQLLSSLPPKG